jgi:hypothetical protein
VKRYKHNLSHYKLLTGKMMQFLPVGCIEVLPGDTFQHQASVMLRVSPLAAPVMHPVHVRLHHFYVPNRLVWASWQDFITGGPDGTNADTVPTIQTSANTMTDYLYGCNTNNIDVNALPLYGANTVWNEYYRDQDLMAERSLTTRGVPNVAWEKDYLTTARPWADKGDAVTLPVGSEAPVLGIGKENTAWAAGGGTRYESDGTSTTYSTEAEIDPGTANESFWVEQDGTTGYPNIRADLSAATAIGLNDFRRALALQRYQEARARYGSRFVEYLRYAFGVTSSDGRLDRPEYLGGGKTTINFSEVLQTGPETGTSPTNAYGVGDMYGHGVAAMRSNGYRKFFEEHGFVLSFLTVRPKSIYGNAIHRSFLRQDREDYFQRELAYIGQQEVYQNEIYGDAAHTRSDVWGYSDRYAEYKSMPSTIAGDFRSTLDHYHQARIFSTDPTLNEAFLTEDAPTRIHNVTSGDTLWCMVNHRLIARRTVPISAQPRTF